MPTVECGEHPEQDDAANKQTEPVLVPWDARHTIAQMPARKPIRFDYEGPLLTHEHAGSTHGGRGKDLHHHLRKGSIVMGIQAAEPAGDDIGHASVQHGEAQG